MEAGGIMVEADDSEIGVIYQHQQATLMVEAEADIFMLVL